MTAVATELNTTSGGDTDFFSSSSTDDTKKNSKGDDAPLGSDTEVSADSVDGKVKKDEEHQQQRGVFGRLFGRREEPKLQNGAADLLDDERPVEEGGESNALVVSDEEEDVVSGEEEEEDSGDTDVGVDPNTEQHQNATKGVFGRLFGRKGTNQGPTLQNGASDLLDDEPPQEQEDSGAVVTDDEASGKGDEEEEEGGEEEEDSNTDGSMDPKKEQQPDEPAPGVFGRMFGRKGGKQEPSVQNGAADLLDDERPMEEEGSAVATDDDNIESFDADDEEEESEDDDDEFEDDDVEDAPPNSQQNDFAAFANFDQAASNRYEDTDDDYDEEDEMMSLISGPKTTVQRVNSNNNAGLGASLTKFLGFGPKKQEQQPQKDEEKQSLLHDNGYDTEEDDDARSEKHGLVRSSSDDFYDAQDGTSDPGEYDDDDDDAYRSDDNRSEPGEYRLESFHPSVSGGYQDQPSTQETDHQQDLHGRIHGFGSESALGYYHDSSNKYEQRGILNGLGKAVSNITQIILQRRRVECQNEKDQEKKQMLQYITKLELKLVQKERELQTWKERAEQLKLEVAWLNGNKEKDGEAAEDEEEEESESDSEADNDATQGEAKEGSLLLFEEEAREDPVEETGGTQEGALIDLTPTKPVFDPLEEKHNDCPGKKVEDDLMDASHYQEQALGPNDEGGLGHEDQTIAFFDSMEESHDGRIPSTEEDGTATTAGGE